MAGKISVVVLGATGMLGSMVYSHLRRNQALDVVGTSRDKSAPRGLCYLDAERLAGGLDYGELPRADYAINCIGVIKPHCKDNDAAGVRRAIAVNAMFPHRLGALARERRIKVIQIATDCVYSGTKGKYTERDPHDALDVYGKSKSLGEVFDGSLLNIRCSIIGPERKGRLSLLEWFLGNKPGAELTGFAHHHWNGVTTLQFSQLCEVIVERDLYDDLLKLSPLHHFVPNATVDKFELLIAIQGAYGRDYKIKRVSEPPPAVDRSLATSIGALNGLVSHGSVADALVELKAFQDRGYYD